MRIEPEFVLRGPAERVLARRSTVKPLVVATAGIGLAGTMLQLVATHVSRSTGPLNDLADELAARFDAVRERLYRFGHSLNDDGADVLGLIGLFIGKASE